MEVVFVASEMIPFATTGGLGEVLGSLPEEIVKFGHRVSIFLPKYKRISEEKFSLEATEHDIHVPIGSEVDTGTIFSCRATFSGSSIIAISAFS